MLQVIHHRGPDDDGVYIDGNLAMGMRRLSIIDLGGGKQPIYNEDGRFVVVFNGEIYNFRELMEQLQARGHVFKTVCDTEVIVHLYEEMGDECVQHLRGMFGFAVWDTQRRRLFVARDRLGIKPLYYTQMGGGLVFGSEIKALLQHPDVRPRMDLQGLNNFLSLKYVPAPQTMFADIFALPPGYTLTCDDDGIRINQYWDLSFAQSTNTWLSEDEYAEQLETLLREVVNMHLMSDVPFGAFLSGGVDSSTIVALMSQFLNEPVKTFSVGFKGSGAIVSELPYAHMVSKQWQTEHYDIFITPDDFTGLTEKVIWHLDQPIADEASLANYMVAELASRHVKMVLTGEGGDELFAGYARYAGERFSPLFKHLPLAVRGSALSMTTRLVPGMRRPKLALYALCHSDEVTRMLNWFPLFNSDMKAALLSDTMKQALNGHSSRQVFADHLARTDAKHPLNRMLYVDTKLWLPDDLLARGDKTSMATSLEARVPLLDHKLVEFAASLPPSLKLKRLTRKYLLKKVSQQWLPEEIINRKKEGFPTPIAVWIRNEVRPFVRDLLSPDTIRRRGLFNTESITTLLDEHESGFADHGAMIWALISIELWQRRFLDQSTVAHSRPIPASQH